MISNRENLSTEEVEFLKLLDDRELLVFDFRLIKSSFDFSAAVVQDMLTRLVKKEFIFSIEKSKYCVRNFRNPYVISNTLLKSSAVAYWSALNLHGLTEQIPNTIFSQSSFRKEDKTVFGVRYKFVKVKPEKLCGHTKMGFGNESFLVTDVEKTILDCFDLPEYSGGYEELIRALYNAKLDPLKLLNYGKQMGNISVLKRIAFLAELFEMKNFDVFQSEILKIVNRKYSLLDSAGDNNGAFNSKWRIRINIPESDLLSVINKMY